MHGRAQTFYHMSKRAVVRHSKMPPLMSLRVKTGKAQNEHILSALTPKADMERTCWHVRYVPGGDIRIVSRPSIFR
jgi:hypothetical protein